MRAHIQIPHSDGAHTLSGRFCELCDRNQAGVRGAQSANFLYIDKNVGAKISSRHVHMLRKRHGKLCRRLIWGQRRSDVSLCHMGDAYLFGRHASARTHTLRPNREESDEIHFPLCPLLIRAHAHMTNIYWKSWAALIFYTRDPAAELGRKSAPITRPPRWCSSSLSLQHARKGTIGGHEKLWSWRV